MPLEKTLITLEMASHVSDYILKRGGWPDCTPEAILERASSYDELHKWIGTATGDRVPPFPRDPKYGDVIHVAQCGISYCYAYNNSRWNLVDAMPAHLRFMW